MNAVVPSQQFQEKLFEKIRDSIGELMTEEDLKKLVEATFHRVFFTPQISTNDYGRESSRKPPRIEELVQELVRPSLVTAAKAWLDEHPDVVQQALDKALEGGLQGAILRTFESLGSSAFESLRFNLHQSLQNALQR